MRCTCNASRSMLLRTFAQWPRRSRRACAAVTQALTSIEQLEKAFPFLSSLDPGSLAYTLLTAYIPVLVRGGVMYSSYALCREWQHIFDCVLVYAKAWRLLS
jgi:hypothetical protein